MAAEGTTGLSIPIRMGIEPGSGPAHLSLFSYDPVKYEIGRGVLEALGIGFQLAADRSGCTRQFRIGGCGRHDYGSACRAYQHGRVCAPDVRSCRRRRAICLPGYEVFVEPVKEHRFVLVIRGEGLGGDLSETDPLVTGKKPLPVEDASGTAGGRAYCRAGEQVGGCGTRRAWR